MSEGYSQTTDFIKSNIMKIVDSEGILYGTGFFLEVTGIKYCITCHHCIYGLNKIFVEKNGSRFNAEWIREFSDMAKDLAVLQVKDCNNKPLKYFPRTPPKISIFVWGYPINQQDHFPDGKAVEGKPISSTLTTFNWPETEIEGENEWNEKPKVSLDAFWVEGTFVEGFSGAPVCYEVGYQVVGIFTAKDDVTGYVIPIETLLGCFDQEPSAVKIRVEKLVTRFRQIQHSSDNSNTLRKMKSYTDYEFIPTIKFLKKSHAFSQEEERDIEKVLEEIEGHRQDIEKDVESVNLFADSLKSSLQECLKYLLDIFKKNPPEKRLQSAYIPEFEPEFETKQQLPTEYKTAPAGSKLRNLLKTQRGELSYTTLSSNKVGKAHMNNTVEEIWFFIQGIGEFWRKQGVHEQTVTVSPNTCLTIPPRTHFQYRNLGDEPLVILIVTMPPFPGDEESVSVEGKWDVSSD